MRGASKSGQAGGFEEGLRAQLRLETLHQYSAAGLSTDAENTVRLARVWGFTRKA